jgi:hypothetical protein
MPRMRLDPTDLSATDEKKADDASRYLNGGF